MAMAIAALLTYCLYICTNKEANVAFFTTGNAVLLLVTLFGTMGFTIESKRMLIMMRVVSIIFFLLMFISCMIFCIIGVSNPPYIITNGLLLLIYILILYNISKSNV